MHRGAVWPGAAGLTSTPPAVMVLTQGADNGNGDIFIAPRRGGYASGPEIISNTGKVIWFHAVPAGEFGYRLPDPDLPGQAGAHLVAGHRLRGLSSGTDYIYNDRYQQIAEVNAGNGYSTDGHEFLITPWNTALILADTIATANLTSIGGPADQKVIDGVVQEIDIRTGKVLFQWNSADHVPYRDSHNPLPASAATPLGLVPHQRRPPRHRREPADQLPLHLDDLQGEPAHRGRSSGSLAASRARSSSRPPPVRSSTRAGEIFAFQHDPEAIGNDEYTFFDDESGGSAGAAAPQPGGHREAGSRGQGGHAGEVR